MVGKEPEKKDGQREVEMVPKGIDFLVVAPKRFIGDLEDHSILDTVHDFLHFKITDKTVLSTETWDGNAINPQTAHQYDGIIVICDFLSQVREKIERVSRETSAPVLLVSPDNSSGVADIRYLFHLQHTENGMSSGQTMYDFEFPKDLTQEIVKNFVLYSAYRKLAPWGFLGK